MMKRTSAGRRAGLGMLLGVWVAGAGAAEGPVIPAEWLRAMPGERQAAAIEEGAARAGWPAMAEALHAGALEAYARGNLATAEAWLRAADWAKAWGETPREFGARWAEAMAAAGWPGGRPEARAEINADKPMAEVLPRALRLRLLADAGLAAEYFSREHALDYRPEVFRLLGLLHGRDEKAFAAHRSLALAVALVHDTPPREDWPHWQVTTLALPRRLAPPEEVFDHLVGLAKEGRALHRPGELDAAELRFAVDLVLPAEERAWALARVKAPLPKLAEVYSMIRYRSDRIDAGAYVWPGESYRMADILEQGGICVDQAYFAAQAGKARGVPTLFFSGAGRDGRHAWFGYLGTGRKWSMDAGRDAGQNYVTGVATDPQTWLEFSDHELKFLSEGFRKERNAREAVTQAEFAARFLAAGRAREAEGAARTALRLERRTLGAWEVLLALRPEAGAEREGVAREAAGGLTAYPELQARFSDVVVASLRARGEGEEADRIGREMARRFAGKRGDLSVKEIAGQMRRAMEGQTVEEQMKVYRSLLRQFGRGAGAGLWDEVVKPFVFSLAKERRWTDARTAVGLAREALGSAYGSQIDGELRELDAELAEQERKMKAGR